MYRASNISIEGIFDPWWCVQEDHRQHEVNGFGCERSTRHAHQCGSSHNLDDDEGKSISNGNGYLFVDMQTVKNPSKVKLGMFMASTILTHRFGSEVKHSQIEEALLPTRKDEFQTRVTTFVGGMSTMIQTESSQLIIFRKEALVRNSTELGAGVCFELIQAPIEVPSVDFKNIGDVATGAITLSLSVIYIAAYLFRGTEEGEPPKDPTYEDLRG